MTNDTVGHLPAPDAVAQASVEDAATLVGDEVTLGGGNVTRGGGEAAVSISERVMEFNTMLS